MMNSTRDLSVGELLEQLLADSLVDACHITGETVTIVQGTKRHSFPYRQARTFLLGMLRGRSWNLKGDQASEHGVPPLRAIEKRRQDAAAVLERMSGEVSPSDDHLPAASKQFVRLLGPALDELLSMAVDMELIEDATKDEAAETITIVLSACQTQMQFDEAVVFLSECILYKLNSLRDEVGKLLAETGKNEAARRFERSGDLPTRARAAGEEPVWQPLV